MLRKITSILVILSFFFSNIAFAQSLQTKLNVPQKSSPVTDSNNITVEKDYGLIKSRFTGNSNKLIINIQDAHCNYEAQTNIIKILETLIKSRSLSLISVEGADGLIDTTWFKAFPDEEVRKEVATYFMKKGEITGPEFLSITKNYPIKLFGAEDRNYYIQNLNAFTSSYPLKADTEKYYNSIKNALSRLKGLIYSDELKTMDARSQDYESKKMQFNDYVRFLQQEAGKEKINLRNYENLFRLASVLAYEKKINFGVTDRERSALIDELSGMLTKNALGDLVLQSIAFKSGKLSSVEFYNYLKKLAIGNNVNLSGKYTNLYNYIIYNSVYSKIDNEKLFSDIKALEADIKEKLFTADDQRSLDKLSRHIDILIGMVNIKLLNGDFNYYQTHRDEFTHEAFTDFIRREGSKYGLAYEVEDPSEAVARSIPKLEDFYAIATKRDKALVDNTLAEMDREGQNIAVLVTGGFHSEGMGKLLEKQGISYIVVCPSITKDVPTPYIQVLTNQRTPIEDILASPEAVKKGMLAPILITQLAHLTQEERNRVCKEAVDVTPIPDKPNVEGLLRLIMARVAQDTTEFAERDMRTWIERHLAVPGPAPDIDVLYNALIDAMIKILKDSLLEAKRLAEPNITARPDIQLTPAEENSVGPIVEGITNSPGFKDKFTAIYNQIEPPSGVGSIRGNGGLLMVNEHGSRTLDLGFDGARNAEKEGTVNGIIHRKILENQAHSLLEYTLKDSGDQHIPLWDGDTNPNCDLLRQRLQATPWTSSTNLILIKGFKEELARQGVAQDLIIHSSAARGLAYMDKDTFEYLMSLSNGVDLMMEALMHEVTHNKNPGASEEEVEVAAPTINVRAALNGRRTTEEIQPQLTAPISTEQATAEPRANSATAANQLNGGSSVGTTLGNSEISEQGAITVTGEELTEDQKNEVNNAIRNDFTSGSARLHITTENGIEIYEIPSLEGLPYLVAHPGRGGEAFSHPMRRIYMSPSRILFYDWMRINNPTAWNQFIAHEQIHIDHPEYAEAQAEAAAPTIEVRAAFAVWRAAQLAQTVNAGTQQGITGEAGIAGSTTGMPVALAVRDIAVAQHEENNGMMTSEQIHTTVTEPGIKSLNITTTSLLHDKASLVKGGKVLVLTIKGGRDTEDADHVTQAIATKINRNLEDLVIDRHVTMEQAIGAATMVVDKERGNIRAIVIINEDERLTTTPKGTEIQEQLRNLNSQLMNPSPAKNKIRILDVQTRDAEGKQLFIPVPAIYDLALRFGFEMEIDAEFTGFLRRIGLFYDADGKPIDPAKLASYFVIRIIPRARPIDVDADTRAQHMAKEAVDASL